MALSEDYNYTDKMLIREYLSGALRADSEQLCELLENNYGIAVIMNAAGSENERRIKSICRGAGYIFDLYAHEVVVMPSCSMRQYATRAAAELDAFAVYEDDVPGEHLFEVFTQICALSDYGFYSGLAAKAQTLSLSIHRLPLADERRIERLAHSESFDRIRLLCSRFFDELAQKMPAPDLAREETGKIIGALLENSSEEAQRAFIIDITSAGFINMRKCRELADAIVSRMMREHGISRRLSPLIADTLEIIEKNLANEELSLRWIAQEILFTNPDYLGKLFKKEMGDNFTGYVKKMRMELAKRLILQGKRDRIYEVAEKVGFGTNSQYFSQVFKKYTGVSPLEYKSVIQNTSTVNNLYEIHVGENV